MNNLVILAKTAEEALEKAPAGYNFVEECDSGTEEKAFMVFETSSDRNLWLGQN